MLPDPVVPNIVIEQRSAVPLYEQICQGFRRQIETGLLVPGAALPTSHALCAQLNVSYKTVHQAMAKLADEGYVVRRARRGTIVKGVPCRGVIGIYSAIELFGQNSKHEYYRILVENLNDQIQSDGQVHRMYLGSQSQGRGNTASEDLIQHISDGILGALLVTCPFARLPEVIELGRLNRIPVIALFNGSGADYSVVVDFANYVRQGIGYLQGKGCKRIGVIYNKRSRAFSDPKTIIAIYQDSGLAYKSEWIAGRIESEDGGYEAACSLPLSDLDGLVVEDDLMALGVDRRLQEININVPHSLSVTTFWNHGSRLELKLPFERFEIHASEQVTLCLNMMRDLIFGQRVSSPHPKVTAVSPNLVAF